jgi:DNA-binding MarR family transcriptional regulator
MCNQSPFGEYQTADMFEHCGQLRKGYEVFDRFPLSFAETATGKATKADILHLLKKDATLTPDAIAKALNVTREWVSRNIAEMVKGGAITQTKEPDGNINRTIEPSADEILKRLPPPKVTDIILRYSYQKRAEASGPDLLPTSRPFCKKLVGLEKEGRVYSRADIEKISARVGYDVFTRTGGFWNNDGTIEIHCRHYWMTEILIKEK